MNNLLVQKKEKEEVGSVFPQHISKSVVSQDAFFSNTVRDEKDDATLVAQNRSHRSPSGG